MALDESDDHASSRIFFKNYLSISVSAFVLARAGQVVRPEPEDFQLFCPLIVSRQGYTRRLIMTLSGSIMDTMDTTDTTVTM
jgi:hypothetical protein